jgi:predicted signal transduction protein with EAL and GGDEF domain
MSFDDFVTDHPALGAAAVVVGVVVLSIVIAFGAAAIAGAFGPLVLGFALVSTLLMALFVVLYQSFSGR